MGIYENYYFWKWLNQRDKLKFQEELIQAAFGFKPPNDPHDCNTGIDWQISLRNKKPSPLIGPNGLIKSKCASQDHISD